MAQLVEDTMDFIKAIESTDWLTVSKFLTEDFRYFGEFHDPIGKEVWLEFLESIVLAFPNWSWNVTKVEQVDEDHVIFAFHVTGTHTKKLILPIEGIKPLLPTFIQISLPIEKGQIRFKEDKIFEIRLENLLHGGLPGILQQLGYE